jgi:hypothetical protein
MSFVRNDNKSPVFKDCLFVSSFFLSFTFTAPAIIRFIPLSGRGQGGVAMLEGEPATHYQSAVMFVRLSRLRNDPDSPWTDSTMYQAASSARSLTSGACVAQHG